MLGPRYDSQVAEENRFHPSMLSNYLKSLKVRNKKIFYIDIIYFISPLFFRWLKKFSFYFEIIYSEAVAKIVHRILWILPQLFPVVASYVIIVKYQKQEIGTDIVLLTVSQTLFSFLSVFLCIHWCVCVYISVQFDSTYRYVVVVTELFHLHKGTPSCSSFIVRPSSLYAGNLICSPSL